MLRIIDFFGIFVLIIIVNVAIARDVKCLEDLFEATVEDCPLPDQIYKRNAIHAFHLCTFQKLGVVNDDGSFIKPHTHNTAALITYAKAIGECELRDPSGIPTKYRTEPFSECALRAVNLLKATYIC